MHGAVDIEPRPVVAHQKAYAVVRCSRQGDHDLAGAGVADRVVQGLLGHAQHDRLVGEREGRWSVLGVGQAGAVGARGPVEDLHLFAQHGREAVLGQAGGPQLEDGGLQLLGGLAGQGRHLAQERAGGLGVAVEQQVGRLGGEPQAEQPLSDRVVKVVGYAGAFLGDGQLATAGVEPRVGQSDRRVSGQDFDQLLVAGGEAARLVGQVERAEDLVAADHGHAEERGQHRVGGGPPAEARIGPDVVEALGDRLAQHDGQEAVLAGQGADRGLLLGAHAGDDELGERTAVVGDAERGVVGACQLAGRVDDRLQHLGDGELVADRQHRRRQAARRAQFVHALTIVARAA